MQVRFSVFNRRFIRGEIMDLAWLSLGALLLVIGVSCTAAVNPGLLSIALAWGIAALVAPQFGVAISVKELLAGFPSDLFVTLLGITLLFTQAQVNGTLPWLARRSVALCGGRAGLVPLMFFALTFALSAVGAGNIASAALMAPLAMSVAPQFGVSPFLMTIMVAHGAIAGSMSPFTPGGIVAQQVLQDKVQLGDYLPTCFWHNVVANVFAALAGYVLFGGRQLLGARRQGSCRATETETDSKLGSAGASPSPAQWLTLVVLVGLIVAVLWFKSHVGLAALTGAVLLAVFRCTDEAEAVRKLPWGVIVMVCGVTVLTAIVEKTGGTQRFAELVSRFSTPNSIAPLIALLTGIISIYSSTSGVVLPTFLPLTRTLVEQLGGGRPETIVSAIVVGSNLVDASPLSTIGALCIAAAPLTEDRIKLFRKTMAWSFSMAAVGALLSSLCL